MRLICNGPAGSGKSLQRWVVRSIGDEERIDAIALLGEESACIKAVAAIAARPGQDGDAARRRARQHGFRRGGNASGGQAHELIIVALLREERGFGGTNGGYTIGRSHSRHYRP